MRESKSLAAARLEAEEAQAGFKTAVRSLGRSAESARIETTAKARRYAPLALGAAGVALVAGVLLRRR